MRGMVAQGTHAQGAGADRAAEKWAATVEITTLVGVARLTLQLRKKLKEARRAGVLRGRCQVPMKFR